MDLTSCTLTGALSRWATGRSSASVTEIVAFSPLPLPLPPFPFPLPLPLPLPLPFPLPEPFSPSPDDSLATVPTFVMCPWTVLPLGSVTGADSPTRASCCWVAFTCSCTICRVEVVPSTSSGAPAEPPPSLEPPLFEPPLLEPSLLEPSLFEPPLLEAPLDGDSPECECPVPSFEGW